MRRALIPWGPGQQLAVSGTGLLVQGSGCATYSSAFETTGAAAGTVAVYDGGSKNGQLLMYYTLSSGQSTSEEWGPHWLPFEEGLYVETVTGSVAGTLSLWLDHLCETWLTEAHWAAKAVIAEAVATLAPGA